MADASRFGLTGIDEVIFAVENHASAVRFAEDWGLTPAGNNSADGALFKTVDGSAIQVSDANAELAIHKPVGAPSGLHGIIWGVSDADALERIALELQRDRAAVLDADGVLQSHDDLGFGLAFRIAQRKPVHFEATQYNAPGQPGRVDRRAVRYARAIPHEISHVAINVRHAAEAATFYEKRLGFVISDRYADRGVFLRCAPAGNHHHLFLMNGKDGGVRFNHLAFKVRDIHEVIGGGQYIESRGWQTFAGPGRHHVSSANFWYFNSPFGGAWEYAADEDIVTPAWTAHDFAAEAHIFSEWVFGLEESDGTLRGPISQSVAKP